MRDARLEFLSDGTIAANIDDSTGAHDVDVPGFEPRQIPAKLLKFLDPRRKTRRAA